MTDENRCVLCGRVVLPGPHVLGDGVVSSSPQYGREYSYLCDRVAGTVEPPPPSTGYVLVTLSVFVCAECHSALPADSTLSRRVRQVLTERTIRGATVPDAPPCGRCGSTDTWSGTDGGGTYVACRTCASFVRT